MVLDRSPQLLFANVMHHRLVPKQNQFSYAMYYFNFPTCSLTSQEGNFLFSINKPALFSIYNSDYGDGKTSPYQWLSNLLQASGMKSIDLNKISLITLPRVMGYVFNPVSFWLCCNNNDQLCAVICEVNNTFGERHTYVCAHEDHRPILPQDELTANKVFHVSPFLERDGVYKFRFSFDQKNFTALIDHYGIEGAKILATSVVGRFTPMTSRRLLSVFISYPFITLKVIFLIHWQAVKIFLSGIPYVPKPSQNSEKISHSYKQTIKRG
jgi:uncharacterized protein